MHASQEFTASFLEKLRHEPDLGCQLLVCPPFPYLQQASQALKGSSVSLGAQDCAANAEGAHTGEVAASMLADLGVGYVLLGHSERRLNQGEDNDLVLRKVRQALSQGVKPIVCVGETLEERENGATAKAVLTQVEAIATQLRQDELKHLIFAYEPVWAIGTGLSASPEQAQEVHALIRAALKQVDSVWAESVQLLYGGSVKAENAASLFAMPDIDGGLIGGASLDVSQFLAIGHAAS